MVLWVGPPREEIPLIASSQIAFLTAHYRWLGKLVSSGHTLPNPGHHRVFCWSRTRWATNSLRGRSGPRRGISRRVDSEAPWVKSFPCRLCGGLIELRPYTYDEAGVCFFCLSWTFGTWIPASTSFYTIIYLFGRDTVLISSPWLKPEGMS